MNGFDKKFTEFFIMELDKLKIFSKEIKSKLIFNHNIKKTNNPNRVFPYGYKERKQSFSPGGMIAKKRMEEFETVTGTENQTHSPL